MKLNICHLYPDLMDTYGDRGNIISIVKRCKWRNISVTIKNLSTGDKHSAYDYDFYFFGGGQDKAFMHQIARVDIDPATIVFQIFLLKIIGNEFNIC